MKPAQAAVLVAAVAFATSANTLLGGFVFDDLYAVVQNPWIRDPGRLGAAFTHHLAAFDPRFDTSYYRPMTHVAFTACYLAAGLRPWAFHLLNLLLHAGVSACVYLLLRRWSRPDAPAHAALIGALLFAVHPVHVESVAWISDVGDVSCAFFSLLALLLATGPRSRASRVVLAPLLLLVAALSKEPALMFFPIVTLALAMQGGTRDAMARRNTLFTLTAFSAAVAIYLWMRVRALDGLMGGGARRVSVPAPDAALTAVALFGEHVRKLILPLGIGAVSDFGVVRSALSPHALFGVAALASAALLVWRARKNRAVLLGLALFLLPLLPALYVPALGEELFAPRYLYLPSVGAALLAASALAALPVRKAWIAGGGAVLVGSLALVTVVRNRVWHDDVTLWSDAVAKTPGRAAAHEYLGHALLAAGDPPGAVEELKRALELEPGRIDARVNLASALAISGRLDDAVEQAQAALREKPSMAKAHVVLAWALLAQGRLRETLSACERALALDPLLGDAHNVSGVAWARLGEFRRAERDFAEAVRLDPGNGDYARNLAGARGAFSAR